MLWLAYPVGYLGYSLARGAVDGWYPYFFIDVGVLGYTRALTNAALLSVAMLMAGCVLVGGEGAAAIVIRDTACRDRNRMRGQVPIRSCE